jgi:hypothetical protein
MFSLKTFFLVISTVLGIFPFTFFIFEVFSLSSSSLLGVSVKIADLLLRLFFHSDFLGAALGNGFSFSRSMSLLQLGIFKILSVGVAWRGVSAEVDGIAV